MHSPSPRPGNKRTGGLSCASLLRAWHEPAFGWGRELEPRSPSSFHRSAADSCISERCPAGTHHSQRCAVGICTAPSGALCLACPGHNQPAPRPYTLSDSTAPRACRRCKQQHNSLPCHVALLTCSDMHPSHISTPASGC